MAIIAARGRPSGLGLEELAGRVLERDAGAWSAFAATVHDRVLAICKRRRYRDHGDAHREVALRVLERLHAADFAALRQWAAARERYPEATLDAWLAAVTSNAFVDHLRASADHARRTTPEGRRLVAIEHRELAPDLASASDPAAAAELVRILRVVSASSFPVEQRAALAMWLQGCDATEIAAELGLSDTAAAHRLLHAARERLRRALRPHGKDN